MNDEELRTLHDKRARGLALSKDEEARLNAWYVQHDAEERALSSSRQEPPVRIMLQARKEAINHQLQMVTEHVRKATAENARLRDEITKLQEQIGRSNAPP